MMSSKGSTRLTTVRFLSQSGVGTTRRLPVAVMRVNSSSDFPPQPQSPSWLRRASSTTLSPGASSGIEVSAARRTFAGQSPRMGAAVAPSSMNSPRSSYTSKCSAGNLSRSARNVCPVARVARPPTSDEPDGSGLRCRSGLVQIERLVCVYYHAGHCPSLHLNLCKSNTGLPGVPGARVLCPSTCPHARNRVDRDGQCRLRDSRRRRLPSASTAMAGTRAPARESRPPPRGVGADRLEHPDNAEAESPSCATPTSGGRGPISGRAAGGAAAGRGTAGTLKAAPRVRPQCAGPSTPDGGVRCLTHASEATPVRAWRLRSIQADFAHHRGFHFGCRH